VRGGQQWPLRSVDSQCQGRAIEPREQYPRRASVFVSPGAVPAHRSAAWCARSRRGRRTGPRHCRVPQEPGTPCTLHDARPAGDRITNSWLAGYACWTGGSEVQAHVVVSPSEAQRSAARRGQGIGALHSTAEAGEPNPRGPGGGKGAPGSGTAGRKQDRCSATGPRVHATTAASGVGEAVAIDGLHFPQPPPGPSLAGGGLPPDAEGQRPRRGRADQRRLGVEPAGQPEVAAGPCQVGRLLRAPGTPGAYPERDGSRDPPPGDSGVSCILHSLPEALGIDSLLVGRCRLPTCCGTCPPAYRVILTATTVSSSGAGPVCVSA